MANGRVYFVAVIVMVVAGRWLDYTVARVVWTAAVGYIFIDMMLRARAGYRRRLPHWTPESWRRFFTVTGMFAFAFLIFVCMMATLELRIPIAGAARSTQRMVWIVIMMAFMVLGVGGLACAVGWLHENEPTEQFKRFQRRQGQH